MSRIALLMFGWIAALLASATAFVIQHNDGPAARMNHNNRHQRDHQHRTRTTVVHMSAPAVPRTSFLAASNANELNPLKPGSTVALVTPFDQSTGQIDYGALRRLLQYHVQSGTDNLCILGTTGEASTISMDERRKVLTLAVQECKGRMPILVGTGTINPHHVKEMTQQAVDLGCDASLITTPYYVKPPQRCLIQHMVTAADQYGLPVVIYNVPGRTAVNMLDESIAIAAQHPNVVAVKDATGDLSRVASLKAALAQNGVVEDFLLYSGDDGTSMDFVLGGGDGCISVTANVAPSAMHQLMQACRAGQAKKAAEINAPLELLHKKLFVEANPIPTKWAVHRLGLTDSAWCRPPLDALDPALAPQVEEALRYAGLLSDIKNSVSP